MIQNCKQIQIELFLKLKSMSGLVTNHKPLVQIQLSNADFQRQKDNLIISKYSSSYSVFKLWDFLGQVSLNYYIKLFMKSTKITRHEDFFLLNQLLNNIINYFLIRFLKFSFTFKIFKFFSIYIRKSKIIFSLVIS